MKTFYFPSRSTRHPPANHDMSASFHPKCDFDWTGDWGRLRRRHLPGKRYSLILYDKCLKYMEANIDEFHLDK